MPEAALIAALTVPPSADGREIRALPPAVSCLEVRADRVGDLDPDWLRGHFSGDLLYTLRSAAEGEATPAPPSSARRACWRRQPATTWSISRARATSARGSSRGCPRRGA